MNKVVTSKEEIMDVSRRLVLEKGIASLSMRAIAEACGVAVGSIYNYFPSKAELLSAAIGSVWEEIFRPFMKGKHLGALRNVSRCFLGRYGMEMKDIPDFYGTCPEFCFIGQKKGKEAMTRYLSALEGRLVDALRQDENIREGVFGEIFPKRYLPDMCLS